MPNLNHPIPTSRYLARGLSIAATGWLANVALSVELWEWVSVFWSILTMLIFVWLDRTMLRPQDRLAERIGTDTGQLLISLGLVFCPAAVFGLTTSWQWPATWFALAASGLLLLTTFNNRIATWRPRRPRALLAGDEWQTADFPCSSGYAAKCLPRPDAIAWLNEAQAKSDVDDVVIFDLRLTDTEIEGLLEAIKRQPLRLRDAGLNRQAVPQPSALVTVGKRLFDMFCAAVLLTLCAVPMLLIVLLIRFQDGGPALFRQQRLGLDGRCITILKFRSMLVTAGSDPLAPQARNCDPRITPLGHWMRLWGIDELPQLLNVINGDMSMVGPRPHAVAHDLQYGAKVADYALRRAAKPGLTGLAQVRGMRGETRASEDMALRINADLEYIGRQSLFLDLRILFATPMALLRSEPRHETRGMPQKDSDATKHWPVLNDLSTTTCQDAEPHVDSHCEDSRGESA
ncbi:putative colanic acid biosysnthesis UDP-glucose lipid carrier transferase [Pseudomonas asturiensis]|uniref:Putative colanic acid biosysnthesis UDP-glucose lipid carrier transferase n=1 Tax=Pseudomonas asturiensis TaxID=1190415 RepID=A0A1M7JVP2_9PSED|nr:sugar transferase [Pseudomonas asturiensis]SHM56597.1 putative colanic acid biosysnthesis UDP-glucose lipid carrier transferase [Pseudomonas asturiensis]